MAEKRKDYVIEDFEEMACDLEEVAYDHTITTTGVELYCDDKKVKGIADRKISDLEKDPEFILMMVRIFRAISIEVGHTHENDEKTAERVVELLKTASWRWFGEKTRPKKSGKSKFEKEMDRIADV